MDVRLRGRVGQAVVVVAANGGSGGGSRVVESGVRGGSGGRRGRLLVGAEELALGGLHLGGVLGLVALAEANGKEDWKNDLKGLQYFWLKAGCTYLLHLLRDTFSYKALHLGNTRRRCTTTAPESVHRSEHLSALAEARVRRRRLYIRCIGGGVGTGEVDITNERARARAGGIERVERSSVSGGSIGTVAVAVGQCSCNDSSFIWAVLFCICKLLGHRRHCASEVCNKFWRVSQHH